MQAEILLRNKETAQESIAGDKEAKVFGRHIYGNMLGCNNEILRDEDMLRNIAADAAHIGNMTLLDVKSWRIGEGVSVVAIILESHITIHTWPEHSYATVDVYSCGAHTNPELAFQYIAERLEASKVDRGVADRSLV